VLVVFDERWLWEQAATLDEADRLDRAYRRRKPKRHPPVPIHWFPIAPPDRTTSAGRQLEKLERKIDEKRLFAYRRNFWREMEDEGWIEREAA
jgi:hypothetical protein